MRPRLARTLAVLALLFLAAGLVSTPGARTDGRTTAADIASRATVRPSLSGTSSAAAKSAESPLLHRMTVAPVVVGVIWRLIFSSETGFVDPVFTALGLGAPRMLTHEATAFWGLVMVDVWEWTPLLFLICLAGLQGLPQEPLEAATVDGAGPIRVFFNHTLPLLIPVLAVGIILRLIDAIGTFDQIFVLTRGGPGTATQLISIYAYNTAFNFTDYGHGAAMLIALLVFVFLLVLVAVSLMRRAARKSS